MLESKSYFKIEYSSERKFGLLFAFVFLIIALYPKYYGNDINYWFIIFSSLLFFASIFFSQLLIFPNKLWIKLGLILGYLISPIIMFFIFVLTFYPIGFIFKIFNIDFINKNYDLEKKTYWISRKNKMESLKKLF